MINHPTKPEPSAQDMPAMSQFVSKADYDAAVAQRAQDGMRAAFEGDMIRRYGPLSHGRTENGEYDSYAQHMQWQGFKAGAQWQATRAIECDYESIIDALKQAVSVLKNPDEVSDSAWQSAISLCDKALSEPAPFRQAAPDLDFTKPLETVDGKSVTWVCSDVIEVDCARVCVDQNTGIVYSSPCRGLQIRNVKPASQAAPSA